ncbi:MAG: NADH-dependent dehydrogenase [Pirellulaceae bacterium]|nr:MAG: NADH-dependent dehydrogenase [Pirellulaceae bacterium]
MTNNHTTPSSAQQEAAKRSGLSRRHFVATSAGAALVPYFAWQTKGIAQEVRSKNDRFNIGIIGAGGMAGGNMGAAKDWVDIVAIADVDAQRREHFNERLAGGKATCYEDYRAILERDDVDVIHIATPDHWHTKPLVEAMLAGKDVYCEKPLTLTIDEGKLIRRIQKDTGRIVQVGTQQRSTFNLFVKAMALVAEGRLGRIHRVSAAIGGAPSSPEIPVAEVPQHLNWDRWLGPTPAVPYRFLKSGNNTYTNCHYEFRWWYEYSGGKLTDWGAHHVDIAMWALHLNGQSEGPRGIRGTATHPVEFQDGEPVQRDRYNTATEFHFTVDFPSGTELIIRHDTDNGVLIEGDKGRIFVNRGKLVGAPVEALRDDPLPEDALEKVYKGLPMEFNERKAHWANFFYCVKNRREPISDVHSHMAMLNICHLAGIAARLGRDLKWDAEKETIVGDEQAAGMMARPYRAGYEIEGV